MGDRFIVSCIALGKNVKMGEGLAIQGSWITLTRLSFGCAILSTPASLIAVLASSLSALTRRSMKPCNAASGEQNRRKRRALGGNDPAYYTLVDCAQCLSEGVVSLFAIDFDICHISGSLGLHRTDTNIFAEALQEYLDKRARKTRHKKEARRRDEP